MHTLIHVHVHYVSHNIGLNVQVQCGCVSVTMTILDSSIRGCPHQGTQCVTQLSVLEYRHPHQCRHAYFHQYVLHVRS